MKNGIKYRFLISRFDSNPYSQFENKLVFYSTNELILLIP